MRRRGGGIFVGAIAAALLASFAPDLRLAAELAEARRDGLWASTDEMIEAQSPPPAELDAAPEVDALSSWENRISWAHAATNRGLYEALRHTIEGRATAAERRRARAWIDGKPDLLRGWREAASRPRFGSGVVVVLNRRFWKGDLVGWGFDRLLVASALGIDARANLFAAAHLAALARQEAGVGSKFVASRYLGEILRQARRQGVEKPVEASMGPPIDVRQALRGGMADMLERMDGAREAPAPRRSTPQERLRRTAPRTALAKLRVVQGWRALWKALLRDPTDYEGAAEAFERGLPKIEAELRRYTGRIERFVYQSPGRPGDWLRQIGRAEAERRAIRDSR